MISAICPSCHILVVEASSSDITDLGTAENEAVALGAKFIDNDWGIPEADLGVAETTYDSEYFDHPGVAITAPAGDDGYGVINYPAASPYVTAVGGTTLTVDTSVPRGYTETAWPSSSSGCSAYEPKPSWQTDTGCTGRTLTDTAADAGTSVAHYDTPTEGG
jgi:subtilase family serine protease